MLARCSVRREVRTVDELAATDSLILPVAKAPLSASDGRYGLDKAIASVSPVGMPLFGTCMGLIHHGARDRGERSALLGLMDVTVRRNAFGRQVDLRV